MKRRLSLARRVFATLILLFTAVVGLVAVSMYATIAGSVEEAVLGNVTRDMALAARDFEIWLSGKIVALETLRHAVLRFRGEPTVIRELLAAATAADPDVPWIYYGTAREPAGARQDARGGAAFRVLGEGAVARGDSYYVDGSGWTPDAGYEWTTRPWFLQSASYPDPVISEPYVDEGTGETVVSISLACKDEAGTLLGVLAADVKLSRLTTVVSMRRFTPHSRTYLVDRDGFYITREERLSESPLAGELGAFSTGSPLEGMGRELLSVERSSGLLVDEGLYYAASRVPRTSWLILSLGPLSDVASPVINFYKALLAISFLALAAAVVFAKLESRAISRPVEALKAGAMALASGRYDYRVSILSKDEFGELGEFLNTVAASLKGDLDRMEHQRAQIEQYSQTLERTVADRTSELAEANTLLRLRNDQMEEEVQMAAAVQRKIVPTEEELPRAPGLSFGARYQAMANVGGDLYDVMEVGRGRYAITIGDVSGHGIPAALIAAMAKASFRAHAALGEDPAAILAKVNAELCELIGEETYFVSAFFALIDAADGSVSYANAGHPPAMLRRADGSVEELDVAEGQLLGISDDFPMASGQAWMRPGDRLLLYTDGIVEARAPDGSFYDSARLTAFFAEHGAGSPGSLAGSIIEEVLAFCAGASQSDDRAVLAVGLDSLRAECGPQSEATDAILSGTVTLVGEGRVEEAAELLESLRRRRPDDHRVMNALAELRLRLGDVAGAERLLRSAVRLCPSSAEYARNLDMVLASKDQ